MTQSICVVHGCAVPEGEQCKLCGSDQPETAVATEQPAAEPAPQEPQNPEGGA